MTKHLYQHLPFMAATARRIVASSETHMITGLGHGTSGSCQPSTPSLREESDDVHRHEDPDDPSRTQEEAIFGVEVGRESREDHVAVGQVGAGGEEQELRFTKSREV